MPSNRSVVVPILREFNADVTLVSAGFNATSGHPPTLGGYSVTPQCMSTITHTSTRFYTCVATGYGHLTRMLMNCGNGRVAVALEGG